MRNERVDEIGDYVNNRYVSAPEAAWRLNTFKMHGRSHSITHLSVHLPAMQGVPFRPGYEQLALERSGSTLTSWFQLNIDDTNARNYLYSEVPSHYTYSHKNGVHKWNRRQRSSKIVARIYGVSPKEGEIFYLRLMLLHIKGAQSFEDLRSVDGRTYDSFKEAAVAFGIVDDDNFADIFLNEAIHMQMPAQIREAFAYLLIFHTPSQPLRIWEQYKEELTLDFFNQQISNDQRFNKGLLHIESVLDQHNKKCIDFSLPQPIGEHEEDEMDPEILLTKAEEKIEMLNDAQKTAFDRIMAQLFDNQNDQSPKCFFIDGPGGSGKTFLYDAIIKYAKGDDNNFIYFQFYKEFHLFNR